MNTLKLSIKFGFIASALAISCAQAKPSKNSGGSKLLHISDSDVRPVAGVTNPATARDVAIKMGYFDGKNCTSGLRGGEVVMYAQGVNRGEENGQLTGVLVKEGNSFYLNQMSSPNRMHGLFAPGISTFDEAHAGQRSSLDVMAYMNLICQVVFGLDGVPQIYESATASLVKLDGGTGGLSVQYSDLLKVEFKTSASWLNIFTVYFKKGFGPVALDFIIANPGGNSETRLFINTDGGPSYDTSADAAWDAKEKSCSTAGGVWSGARCQKEDPAATYESCKGSWHRKADGSGMCWVEFSP